MRWRPKLGYDGGTTLALELWQRPWTPSSRHVGGGDVSAAGIPEVYTIRRDEIVRLTLLFRGMATSMRRRLLVEFTSRC